MPNVTIIGAGPAGSVAAILLARRGWTVHLFEQHRFPRNKVCGECLSAVGIDVLRRHRLLDRLRALGPVPLRRTILLSPDGSAAAVALPAEMWGLSRAAMDGALVDAAIEAGARVWEQHRCEAVEPRIRPSVRVRDLTTGRTHDVRSDVVLLADGKASLALDRPTPTGDFGVKATFAGVRSARDAIALFGLNGHYGGVAPIEHEGWNVAISVPERKLKDARGDLDALLTRLLAESRALHGMFHRAERLGPWLASPLPRFGVADRWSDNVIPLGNAAAAIEPIGGEGMGLAMRSAELAVEVLTSASRAGVIDTSGLRRAYRALWSARRVACRATAMIISSPVLASTTISLLAAMGDAPRAALCLIGKAPAASR